MHKSVSRALSVVYRNARASRQLPAHHRLTLSPCLQADHRHRSRPRDRVHLRVLVKGYPLACRCRLCPLQRERTRPKHLRCLRPSSSNHPPHRRHPRPPIRPPSGKAVCLQIQPRLQVHLYRRRRLHTCVRLSSIGQTCVVSTGRLSRNL